MNEDQEVFFGIKWGDIKGPLLGTIIGMIVSNVVLYIWRLMVGTTRAATRRVR